MRDEAFLEAICETPDDDTPRLVYADWLEENGDSDRAEFIRVQCELARLALPNRVLYMGSSSIGMWRAADLTTDPVRTRVLRRRERELQEKHGAKWSGGLGKLTYNPVFSRGFVEGLQVERPQDVAKAKVEKAGRLHPVRRLQVREIKPNSLEKLLAVPWLARVSALELHGSLGEQGVGVAGARLLAASPHLANLTTLELPYCEIEDDGLRALADSPHLTGLETLNLYSCDLGPEGVRILATASPWKGLDALSLGGHNLRTADVELLAGAPRLAGLQSLNLWTNDLTDNALQSLARSPHLKNLTVLDLYCNKFTDKGAEALAHSGNFRNLQVLELGQNKIGSAGALALADSRHLSQLRALCLSSCRVGSPGLRAGASSPHLKQLAVLDLNDNRVGTPGVRALVRSRHLTGLTHLALGGNRLADADVALLAGCPHLSGLETLELSYNGSITDQGARELLASAHVRGEVNLWGTEVSRDLRDTLGARQLAAS
jgi:uncharacterized protein (TIGR02996 family)